jgi:hypothetical protein
MKTAIKKIKKNVLALISIMVLSVFSNSLKAQTTEEAIKQTFVSFDTAKTYNQKAPIVSQFKLIAGKWPDNWLTNYYAAFAIAVTSFDEPDKKRKEPMLNEADAYFEKIKSMTSTNEEVNILGALLASARIAATPSAYKKYGEIRDKYLEAAKAMNPNNPRVYYIEGNAKYYTPKMFGGGPKKALPLYEKATSLFDAEQKTNIAKPYWGSYHNNYMLSQCKKEIEK